MIKGPVTNAATIYNHPPRKCRTAALTADSIVNSKPASGEGFERIIFMLLSIVLMSKIFYKKRN